MSHIAHRLLTDPRCKLMSTCPITPNNGCEQMFIQDAPSTDEPRASERDDRRARGPARAGGPSPAKLRQIYLGAREAGHPMMLVVQENGTEHLHAPTAGGFDWGWPSLGGARRLAHAMLLDLTGRVPPPWILDTLAAEELAHLPWTAFTLTGQQLLAWIESRGCAIADWPPANSFSHGSTDKR
jgi:hypothetical protein